MKYFYYMFCRGYMIYRPGAYVVTFAWLCSYGFMNRKSVLRANHTIYTPAAYVVTFSRLYSYELY
jgi:hypothetical protein